MGSVFSTPSENASREGNRELQLFPSQQQMGEPSQQMVPLRTTQAATAAGQGSGSTSAPRRHDFEPPLEWTPADVSQLISEHGILVFDVRDENGQPVYWDAIKKGHYDCADMLFAYAKRNEEIPVTFRGEDADLLLWAIENNAHETVRFILEKLTKKCASVEETRDLLTKHLRTIGERCPELLADLLKNDKLTIEYARFQVPKAVFDAKSKIPKTIITTTIRDIWAAMDGEFGKGLWIEHWEEEGYLLGGTDAQITAIAKVFCIGPSVPQNELNVLMSSFVRRLRCYIRSPEHLCEYLHNLNLPVEVFESEMLANFVDHWFQVFRPVYQIIIILNGVATLAFTIFSLTFGPPNAIGKSGRVLWKSMLSASYLLRLYAALHFWSFRRSNIFWIEFVIVIILNVTGTKDHYFKYYAFLISLLCVLQWIAMFFSWQPFERIGTLVSMVNAAVSESWQFLLLMILLIVGYSAAFVAIFKIGSMGEDEENFNSPQHAIETLLYACLGNFDVEMFRPSNSFLAIWAILLFASFIYILPIVLISVLIATVQDIYDRVRLKEKAELRRLRSQTVAKLCPCVRIWCTLTRADWAGRYFDFLWSCYRFLRRQQRPKMADEAISSELYGGYFHFLVPEVNGLDSHDDEWRGKLVEIERTVKSEAQKNERNLKERLVVLDKRIDELDKKITENKLREESWRRHMEEGMDQILQKLDASGPSSS